MAITTSFSTLYTALRKELRDPQGGASEGASPRWTLDEKKTAINDAIRDAFPTIQVPYIDQTTITLSDGTFEYAVPATLQRANDLIEVWVEPDSGEGWKRQGGGWRVRENNGTLKLYIDEVWDSGKKLRLVYAGQQPALSADGDTTVVPMPFVMARAKYYLHSIAAESAARNDMEFHIQRANAWWQISELLLSRLALGQSDIAEGATQFTNWASVD